MSLSGGSLRTVSSDLLRFLVAAWVVAMLGRAGVGAWHHRELTLTVWRRIGVTQIFGAVALLAVVSSLGLALLEWVPPLRVGLGDVVGFTGNAVFVPLEEVAQRAGPAPATGPDWVLIGLSSAFLLPLAALLPWLAFIEEEVFRAGLERTSLGGEALAALVFGLAHLIMLVPLAASLAIAVAGFVYGRIYRRAFRRSDGIGVPWIVLSSFRPTKRARRAADEARRGQLTALGIDPRDGYLVDRTPERRQADAVLQAATWHATFNTLVVTLVYASLVVTSL
ncbi:MAG: hypothetical protein KY469_11700 [Actinobacteria bacterium]|nr:hypothetical protein [Actinomycetota bacterium]